MSDWSRQSATVDAQRLPRPAAYFVVQIRRPQYLYVWAIRSPGTALVQQPVCAVAAFGAVHFLGRALESSRVVCRASLHGGNQGAIICPRRLART